MPEEWKQLVVEAKNDDIGFERLIVKLEPIFYCVARGLTNDLLIEDLVQLARIKIWQSLSRVDLGRVGTIRQFLVAIGVNAMKDYLHCNIRFNNECASADEVATVIAKPTQGEIFSGLLKEYVNYIKMNSTFAGSHQFLAAKYGVSDWVMRGRFHKAVGEFMLELNKDG